MLVIIITALIILLVSLAKNVTYSTNDKDSVGNYNNNDMLKELLQHMDKMQSQMDKMQRHMDNIPSGMDKMQSRMDEMEKNNNIRFDQQMSFMEAHKRNLSMVVESIVEHQLVISAEIFTISNTLPYCCGREQNISGPVETEIATTTTATAPAQYEKPASRLVNSIATNCAEAMGGNGPNGIYRINATNSTVGPFNVYCMKNVAKSMREDIINGAWLIIQRRQDKSTNFYEDWNMYKLGFGDLTGNFWIGLDKLYALTNSTEQELWVQLEDHDGTTAWAKYSPFAIGDESELYKLKTLGPYDGTAGDSLKRHAGHNWSTYDKDNDGSTYINCAANQCRGAWWFHDCADSNLNGEYGNNNFQKGITWNGFRGWEHSLKYTHMAIRPKT